MGTDDDKLNVAESKDYGIRMARVSCEDSAAKTGSNMAFNKAKTKQLLDQSR